MGDAVGPIRVPLGGLRSQGKLCAVNVLEQPREGAYAPSKLHALTWWMVALFG